MTCVNVLDGTMLRAFGTLLGRTSCIFRGSITGNHCIICSIVIVYYSGICRHTYNIDNRVGSRSVTKTCVRYFEGMCDLADGSTASNSESNVVSSLFNTQFR